MRKKLLVIGLLLFTLVAAKMTCNAAEMLQTTNFKGGVNLPWNVSESAEQNSYAKIVNGEFMVHLDHNGENRWDVQIRHREFSLKTGHTYTVHFKLHADKPQKIYVKVGDMGDPYREAWSNNYTAFDIPASGYLDVTKTFTSNIDSPAAEFAFHFGGPAGGGGDCSAPVPQQIYFTEMSLTDSQFVPTATPTPTPPRDIRVNQLGYYPNSAKHATLVSSSTSPVTVQLKDSTGKVVWTGQSQPKGHDVASGEDVHLIDFSSFATQGKNYQLVAGTASSFPFDIGIDMYSQMKYDSLRYFYHARSGVEIKMPYCVESRWARPAGHTTDTATLYPSKPYSDGVYTGGPASLNGTGGWYDAGDHGKYIVNGGISTWTVQNEYERALKAGKASAFADSTMNIPESGNGVPDLLDESRWNVEYFLKVQIPTGYNKAGMVIHKLADEKWTALGVRPDQDDQKRYFYPPSTAATLNFTAVVAQAGRLWKDYDPTFSNKCIAAAETAWQAALAHPDVYAPFGQEMGSGTYGDDYVGDEFYWAACELFITTGKSEYLNYLKTSPHALKCPTTLSGESDGNPGSMDWGNTAACGTIDLVLNAPSGLSATDLNTCRSSMAAAADTYLQVESTEGYGVPLKPSTYVNNFNPAVPETIVDGYPWGSNSFIVNQSMIMAYAYDFTGDKKYIDGVTQAMDYIMGRNPMIKSYVSGYGENPLQYPHHRFFCPQIDSTFPSVPPGFLSGGPNSGCQDPWASGAGLKEHNTPAQKCYIDHVESWSTNEVTINWNAPLAWLSAYLDAVGPQIGNVSPSPSPTTPVGNKLDIDKNGAINLADILLVAAAFNTTPADPRYKVEYDLDNNGAITLADIMLIAAKFNTVV